MSVLNETTTKENVVLFGGVKLLTYRRVMKLARVRLIGWGLSNEARVTFKGILASVPGRVYEVAELTVPCPASDHETKRIAEAVASWRPDLPRQSLVSDRR